MSVKGLNPMPKQAILAVLRTQWLSEHLVFQRGPAFRNLTISPTGNCAFLRWLSLAQSDTPPGSGQEDSVPCFLFSIGGQTLQAERIFRTATAVREVYKCNEEA